MEDDAKKTFSPSSPNPLSSGNDGNEIEKQPIFHQTGAKTLTPKKKILAEWNEDHGPKSNSHKVGISNSGSRKSLPKSNDGDEEDSFVPDSCSSRPYDPLTNYLSPRPKFLRYNPNKHREIVLRNKGKEGSSISPSVSLDSQCSSVYSTAESSLMQESGENGLFEKLVSVEEEELIEERKWGLKWELCKSLIVFSVLVLSTMYISSMNSHLPLPPPARRVLKVEYQNFGNGTFGHVSLRSLEFGHWFIDGREELEIGLFEIGKFGVENERKSRDSEDDGKLGIEIAEKIEPLRNSSQMIDRLDTEDDCEPFLRSLNEVTTIAQASNQGTEEKNVVLGLNEAQMVASDLNEMTEEEILAGFAEKMSDSEPKSKDKRLANDVEIVDEVSHVGIEVENVLDHVKEMVDSEPKSKAWKLEEGYVADYEKKMIESESKSLYEQLEHEAEYVTEDRIGDCVEDNVKNEYNRFWVTSKNVVLLLISSTMTLVVSFLVRFYYKCRKASSKTNSSNVKLCSQQPGLVEKNSLKLPPKVGEKLEQIKKADSHLNFAPIIPRIIPKVRVLSEFVLDEDFRSSLKSCSIVSKMQESEGSYHSVPQERRVPRNVASWSDVAPSNLESSMKADSLSYGSCISQEKTSKKENGKQEMTKTTPTPTPLRRSSRIRNPRGVTSP